MGEVMNGCTLAGKTISSVGAVRLGSTTETGGTAISLASVRRIARCRTRDSIPEIKSATTTNKIIAGASQCLRELFALSPTGCDGPESCPLDCSWISDSRCIVTPRIFNPLAHCRLRLDGGAIREAC